MISGKGKGKVSSLAASWKLDLVTAALCLEASQQVKLVVSSLSGEYLEMFTVIRMKIRYDMTQMTELFRKAKQFPLLLILKPSRL